MTDDELARELTMLGVDASSYRALALLPLVQVAWADGVIQDAERFLIMNLANDRYALGQEGKRVLRNWLHHPPTADFARRGRRALLTLCTRSEYDQVSPADLSDVVALAKRVARSAGGFFGFGAISASEAETIDEIARALGIAAHRPWTADDGPENTPIHRWSAPDEDTIIPADADRESAGPDVEIRFVPPSGTTPDAPCLVLYDQARGDRAMPISQDGVTIGRGNDCNVQIRYDMKVSRAHARLFTRPDGSTLRVYVADLDSVTGTWVNGERVVERRLFGGDQVVVGSVAFFMEASPRK